MCQAMTALPPLLPLLSKPNLFLLKLPPCFIRLLSPPLRSFSTSPLASSMSSSSSPSPSPILTLPLSSQPPSIVLIPPLSSSSSAVDLQPYLRCSMPRKRLRVAVLLSEGVNNSVALHLLHVARHDCTAFYLKIWFQNSAAKEPNKNKKIVFEDEIDVKYRSFKQFDTVHDHSDHYFSRSELLKTASAVKKPSKDWAKRIQHEWKILEKDLPEPKNLTMQVGC